MDRNSLYIAVLVLAAGLGFAYNQKTNGSLEKMFAPQTPQTEKWQQDDPGWDRMPKDPAPVTPPEVQPDPQPQPQPQPKQKQPQQPNRRQPRQQQPG